MFIVPRELTTPNRFACHILLFNGNIEFLQAALSFLLYSSRACIFTISKFLQKKAFINLPQPNLHFKSLTMYASPLQEMHRSLFGWSPNTSLSLYFWTFQRAPLANSLINYEPRSSPYF